MFSFGKKTPTPEVLEPKPEPTPPPVLETVEPVQPTPDPKKKGKEPKQKPDKPNDDKHKDEKHKDKPKDKTKPPKPKPRASSASSAQLPHSATVAGKQPLRHSQDSHTLNQSLKDFRFPGDTIPLTDAAANLDAALANPHIELPPVDDTISAINTGDTFGKRTPAPGSKQTKKPKGIRRKKVKLLPRRVFAKAKKIASRIKNKAKKGKDKVKDKRPKGGLKLRVKIDPAELTGATGLPGAPPAPV
ncbi:hypothetical protein B0T16DRAFT_459832 [Cercophora newfieldiana]|uniref:Uncharacterized protein n=1 Tax=Cercophora newfieldiana TaxID=92897 RepID=A0AA39Y248_9PEZI|nr:hypothetical protein B0T16DRAFT_459832 [Cercophora newfieldiana]